MPVLLIVVGVWAVSVDTSTGWMVHALLVAALFWLLWILARATVCVSAHRDRLTWHSLWRSRVIHWSRIDTVRVMSGRVHVTLHGHFAPASFRLLGVRSADLVEQLRALAAENRIPDSVRFD